MNKILIFFGVITALTLVLWSSGFLDRDSESTQVANNGEPSSAHVVSPMVKVVDVESEVSVVSKKGDTSAFKSYSSKKVRDFCFVHHDNNALNSEDYEQLLIYLRSTKIIPKDLNSLLNIVIAQKQPPGNFYQVLFSIYDNEAYSIRCRDYAIQFMQNVFEFTNQEGRAAIREKLIQIVEHGPEGHPGVAIRAYAGLIRQGFLDDNAQLFKLVKLLALDETVSVSNKATALSVLADAPVLEGATLVRAIINAGKDEDPTILRIAVRVLGDIGDAQDINVVTEFTHHDNALLAKAAQASLAQLHNR